MDDRPQGTNQPGDDTGLPGPGGDGAGHDGVRGTAENVIDTLRGAVDELTERAGPTVRDLADKAAPTVREISARAAELTATAAVKAAPFVKRAGEVTADATAKLGEKSRGWAAEVRGSGDPAKGAVTTDDDEALPTDLAADQPVAPDAAPPFETTAESGTGGPAFDDERQADSPGT